MSMFLSARRQPSEHRHNGVTIKKIRQILFFELNCEDHSYLGL